MKIALVEWAPRICGPTTWLEHLRPGLEALGHAADLRTFSRSGRWINAWHPRKPHPWMVDRVRDAVAVLDEYDLVIFADIVCRQPGLHKSGLVDGLPYYVDVVRRMRTPWTTLVHDHIYPSDEDDVIRASLASRSWTGKLQVTRWRTTPPRIDPLSPRKIDWLIDPYLPYHPLVERTPIPRQDRPAVLTLGRVTSNKGQAVLWSSADAVGADLHVWGYNGFGLPSAVWKLYELGLALGYSEEIHPRVSKPDLTHPNAKKFYTGETKMRTPGGRSVWYHGSPDEIADVDWTPAVGVFMTNTSLGGTMEYAALDAVHAGRVVAMPEHQIAQAGGYTRVSTFAYTDGTVDTRKDGGVRSSVDPDELKSVVETVRGLVELSAYRLQEIADGQYEEVQNFHAPERVARDLLRGLGA